MPRKPLPASPMNILAGGKFHTRNPSTAPASDRGTSASALAPCNQYNNAPPPQTQIASTLAMPSMPSMKLYRLSIHTRYSAASTMLTPLAPPGTPAGITPAGCNHTSAHTAAPKCASKRHRAAIWPWSSKKPISATKPPAPVMAQAPATSSAPKATSKGNTPRKHNTIATPPPRGVGVTCELRAFGTSIRLRAKA